MSLEVCAHRSTRGSSCFSVLLRARLVAGMGECNAQFARKASTLVALAADPTEDPTGLGRATAALYLYRAVEAIEQFEDAVNRLLASHCWRCESGDGPTATDRLDAIPQAHLCAACTAES